MTAITDATQVFNLLRGHTNTTNAELLRVADLFIQEAGSAFQPTDPNAPTNEEKARLFLDITTVYVRGVIMRQRRDKSMTDMKTTVDTDVSTALLDFS